MHHPAGRRTASTARAPGTDAPSKELMDGTAVATSQVTSVPPMRTGRPRASRSILHVTGSPPSDSPPPLEGSGVRS